MGFLERIENFIQGAVEGSASTVLRQKIKPVEIETQLERSMRNNIQPSRGGRIAPNSFTVWLNPDTFRETIAGMEGYNRRCEMILNQFAAQQGYTLLHPRMSVAFDTDARLGRREVRVDHGFDAPPPAPPMRTQTPAPDVNTHTQVIQPATPQPARSSGWILQVIKGRELNKRFTIPPGEVSIGRSRDCDIQVNDERGTVSRRHAIIINHGSELRLLDTKSRNGTEVNGNFVTVPVETILTDGAEINFGECVVRVFRENQQES